MNQRSLWYTLSTLVALIMMVVSTTFFRDIVGVKAAITSNSSLLTSTQTSSITQITQTASAKATAYQLTPTIIRDSKGIDMVTVLPGCFLMGDVSSVRTSPVSEVCFDKTFEIDKYDVTNRAFDEFVTSGGYTNDKNWTKSGLAWRGSKVTWFGDKNGRNPYSVCTQVSSADDQPAVCVTWYEASAYCQWRGGRLPTEVEWEYTARGPGSRLYPWGDTLIPANAVYFGNSNYQTAKVGSKPGGASWVGALDMSGNVWQWVSSIYKDYPYNAADGRENSADDSERVLRGGSWHGDEEYLRSSFRSDESPDYVFFNVGFRCAHS